LGAGFDLKVCYYFFNTFEGDKTLHDGVVRVTIERYDKGLCQGIALSDALAPAV
jgi:hypothetical protein